MVDMDAETSNIIREMIGLSALPIMIWISCCLKKMKQTPLKKMFVDIMLYFGRRGRKILPLLNISDFAATRDSKGEMYIFLKGDQLINNTKTTPTVMTEECMPKTFLLQFV